MIGSRPHQEWTPVLVISCGDNSLLGVATGWGYTPRHGVNCEIASGGRFRFRLAGAMSRFGYLRDPLFLVAVACYVVNRWWLKTVIPSAFLHGRFDDLLLIPAALPVILWVQRILGLREHDDPPSWSEVFLHLAVWSLICEFVGPFWLHVGTADVWDVVAYAVGGNVACLWWNRSTQPIRIGRS
jgi:hypothetical protein